MAAHRRSTTSRSNDNGVSILIVAVSMVFILAMAGLGIDLASLYVGRNQAQRSADAAALAGATALVDQSCVTGTAGSGLSSACMALARQRAEAVANQNLVAGESPAITDADVTFPDTSSSDPQVQVIAGRGTYDGADHSNAMPTFFMKIFGITTASVSAKATAEAYNPSGSDTPIGTKCVKPWLFPNCDEFNSTGTPNPNCNQSAGVGGGSVGSFVGSCGANCYQVARPVDYPSGAIGEPYVIKPASPGAAAAPGQFYAAYIPNASSIPTECPACANPVTSGGSGSGALYRANIECCNGTTLTCGATVTLNNTLQSNPGNMAGPTYQGVDCLIHQDETATGGNGSNCGQDFVSGLSNNCNDPSSQDASGLPTLPSIPPSIMPGANNPYDPSGTQPIPYASSDSVIVAPIFDGVLSSGQNTVQIAGFVQLFIRDVTKTGNPKGNVYAYVLGISACGGGGSGAGGGGSGGGSGGTVVSDTGSYAPVRLIHQ
jgi:Putative Flp pilus-assembly TadE/G-like